MTVAALRNILSDYRSSTAIRALAFLFSVWMTVLARWKHPGHVTLFFLGLFFCALTFYDFRRNVILLLRAKAMGIRFNDIRAFHSLLSIPRDGRGAGKPRT